MPQPSTAAVPTTAPTTVHGRTLEAPESTVVAPALASPRTSVAGSRPVPSQKSQGRAALPVSEPAIGSTRPDADGDSGSAILPPSSRAAEFAASFSEGAPVALHASGRGWSKILLEAYNKQLKLDDKMVGIKDAREDGMAALLFAPPAPVVSFNPATFAGPAAAQLPTEWVDRLEDLMTRAERMAPVKLEVELPLEDGQRLRVRMACIHGQLRCEIQNADAELRNLFLREWPALTQTVSRDAHLRIEQPVFQNPPSGRDAAQGDSFSQRQHRDDPEREAADDAAVLFGARRKFARSGGGHSIFNPAMIRVSDS